MDATINQSSGQNSIMRILKNEISSFIVENGGKLRKVNDSKMVVFIELDSLNVIHDFRGKSEDSSYFDSIIDECRSTIKYLSSYSVILLYI